MVHAFIKENKWVEEGLAVQIDIHKPHDGENNWHAHLLVTTRRFTKDAQRLGKKARDLDPQVRGGRTDTYVKSKDEVNLGNLWKDVQNRIFANHNLENRVDSISLNPQEYVGPVRMRSVMNAAVMRNEQRRIAEIEHLNFSGSTRSSKLQFSIYRFQPFKLSTFQSYNFFNFEIFICFFQALLSINFGLPI